MEEDNVHTSIVIQMGNQEKLENPKELQIQYNEVKVPKDYVIDQIICEDNVTVYALLEISDVTNGLSDKQLVEVRSSGFKDDFRFYHGNSFNETIDKKNFSKNKFDLKMKSLDKSGDLHSHQISKKKSFYCLKHFENRYKIPNCIDDGSDMKVLYHKEMSLNGQNFIKLKTASKGVNTDIAQSPKLLDKVKQAINVRYPLMKKNKTLDFPFQSTIKPSNELTEADENWSNSTFCSEGDSTRIDKQSSSNFLLVPLIMMEEGMLSQFLKDSRNSTLSAKKSLPGDTDGKPVKVSFGINTDFSSLEALHQEESKKSNPNPLKVSFGINTEFSSLETLNQEEIKKSNPPPLTVSFGINTESNSLETSNQDEVKTENSNESPKILMKDQSTEISEQINKKEEVSIDAENKEKILEEIRNLQGQLHALVKCLERKGVDIDETVTKSQENTKTTEPVTSKNDVAEEATKTESKGKSDLLFLKPNISLDKLDDTPPASSNCLVPPAKRESQRSRKSFDIKKLQSIHLSKSSTATSLTFNTSSLKSILENEKENCSVELKLKEEFEFFDSERESFSRKWKGVYLSKSDFSCRYTFSELKYFSCQVIKKSQSLDQRQEKPELFSVKKLKNISFKQEGIFKGKNNSRLHQPLENSLIETFTPLKCEMGDEIAKKGFISPDINTLLTEKESEKDFDKKIIKPENYKVEEGDAKSTNQKHRMAIPKYIHKNERVTAQFCSTHTDAPVKQSKNLLETKTKERLETSVESDTKICNEHVKTNFLKIEQKKISNADAGTKKEATAYKNCIKVSEKLLKYEKKEITKQKSVVGSRKSLIGNSPYSKLHINKLIKNEGTSEVRADNNKSLVRRRKAQEKQAFGKNAETSLSYTLSPKRHGQIYKTPTPPSGKSEKKICNSSAKNSKSSFDETNTKFSQDSLSMSDEILDLDKKIENIYLADSYSNPQNSNASSQSSSVVLEVLSKKPDSEDDLYFDMVSEECKNIKLNENNVSSEISTNKKISDTLDKPVVKSVWALTKVLLFEDGTKKFEVLEASLTPPEHLVNDEKLCSDKSRQ